MCNFNSQEGLFKPILRIKITPEGLPIQDSGHKNVQSRVKEIVNPVTQVDISDPACVKHHFCTGGAPIAIGMRSSIFGAGICLCFRNHAASDDPIDLREEKLSEQFSCDGDDISALVTAP
jgi:hypothetical protein